MTRGSHSCSASGCGTDQGAASSANSASADSTVNQSYSCSATSISPTATSVPQSAESRTVPGRRACTDLANDRVDAVARTTSTWLSLRTTRRSDGRRREGFRNAGASERDPTVEPRARSSSAACVSRTWITRPAQDRKTAVVVQLAAPTWIQERVTRPSAAFSCGSRLVIAPERSRPRQAVPAPEGP
jgi:hypothetical protein